MFSRFFNKRKAKRKRKLKSEGESAVRDRAKKRGARRMEVPLERPQLVFVMAALGTAFIVLLTVFGQRGVLKVFSLKQKILATSEEISSYERRNKELQTLITDLKHDPYTIEQIARKELGLVKPGEIVYEFVDEASSARQPAMDKP